MRLKKLKKSPSSKLTPKLSTPTTLKKNASGKYSLMESFLGEEVVVMHNTMRTVVGEGEQGLGFALVPCSSDGVLMDMDDDFIGLGDGIEVTSVIHKSQIVAMQKAQEENVLDNAITIGGTC